MSTNKTDFLNLNDWVGTDPFRREEINANFRALDAKAKEHEDELGLKADKSEVTTLTTQLADIATYVIDIDAGFFTDPQSLLSDIDGGLFINE